jgi:hypothetical protein
MNYRRKSPLHCFVTLELVKCKLVVFLLFHIGNPLFPFCNMEAIRDAPVWMANCKGDNQMQQIVPVLGGMVIK